MLIIMDFTFPNWYSMELDKISSYFTEVRNTGSSLQWVMLCGDVATRRDLRPYTHLMTSIYEKRQNCKIEYMKRRTALGGL